jgi:hypothetical protein
MLLEKQVVNAILTVLSGMVLLQAQPQQTGVAGPTGISNGQSPSAASHNTLEPPSTFEVSITPRAFISDWRPASLIESQTAIESVKSAFANLAAAPANGFQALNAAIMDAAKTLATFVDVPALATDQAFGNAFRPITDVQTVLAESISRAPLYLLNGSGEASLEALKWVAEDLAKRPVEMQLKWPDYAGKVADVVQGIADTWAGYQDSNGLKLARGLTGIASAGIDRTSAVGLVTVLLKTGLKASMNSSSDPQETALRAELTAQGIPQVEIEARVRDDIDARVESVEDQATGYALKTLAGTSNLQFASTADAIDAIKSAVKEAVNSITGGSLEAADAMDQFVASGQAEQVMKSAAQQALNVATGDGVAGVDNTAAFVASGKASSLPITAPAPPATLPAPVTAAPQSPTSEPAPVPIAAQPLPGTLSPPVTAAPQSPTSEPAPVPIAAQPLPGTLSPPVTAAPQSPTSEPAPVPIAAQPLPATLPASVIAAPLTPVAVDGPQPPATDELQQPPPLPTDFPTQPISTANAPFPPTSSNSGGTAPSPRPAESRDSTGQPGGDLSTPPVTLPPAGQTASTASNEWCTGDWALCQAWHDGGDRAAFGDPADTDTAGTAAAVAARQQFYDQNPQLAPFQKTASIMSPSTDVDAAIQKGLLGSVAPSEGPMEQADSSPVANGQSSPTGTARPLESASMAGTTTVVQPGTPVFRATITPLPPASPVESRRTDYSELDDAVLVNRWLDLGNPGFSNKAEEDAFYRRHPEYLKYRKIADAGPPPPEAGKGSGTPSTPDFASLESLNRELDGHIKSFNSCCDACPSGVFDDTGGCISRCSSTWVPKMEATQQKMDSVGKK